MTKKEKLIKFLTEKKLLVASVGITLCAIIMLLFIINPFKSAAVIGEETEKETETTTQEETTEILLEDIGVTDQEEAAFELNGGTWYVNALGASLAIQEGGIPEGTIFRVRKYNLDESPLGEIIKAEEQITKVYGLYNFELVKDGQVIAVEEGNSITLTLPVPEGASDFLALCHIEPDTKHLDYYNGKIKDGYISFNLNHFSYYCLVELDETEYTYKFGLPVEKNPNVDEKEANKQEHVVENVQAQPEIPPIYEVTGMVHGIDVSRWQGNIDWQKVKESGITFAMIKVCGIEYGYNNNEIYRDNYYKQNIEGALAAGIQVGVYAFTDFVDMQKTLDLADEIVKLISPYQISYPVVFDYEESSRTPSVSTSHVVRQIKWFSILHFIRSYISPNVRGQSILWEAVSSN